MELFQLRESGVIPIGSRQITDASLLIRQRQRRSFFSCSLPQPERAKSVMFHGISAAVKPPFSGTNATLARVAGFSDTGAFAMENVTCVS